ncbi:ABC transporter permease [Curtobacterium poinsettiae]|uniref:ABC transporter permease n=1 Tax=Curtobacterium poinsettiae TaxID=159612 RepID=UPI00217E631B|nr:ABC transporter permease [Curtobacterium flaccumfaciens]MCS6574312.1 ABC transporter permease [Curtobacterium flaccumfaciens pv. flaccumfaciens]MCS6577412.1 ABC transporter permease [Curtobacterium flaccumfaciens]MDD1386564.1 ABC transporter permease [Curtobacterium flaccumfaciens pv. poinsettiae]
MRYLLVVWKRTFWSSLIESFIAPVLYLLGLGYGIGQLSDRVGTGGSYMEYIGPALLLAAALQIATTEASYPVFARFKWDRQFSAITATPVDSRALADAQVAFIALRAAVAGAVYWLVLLGFGAVGTPSSALLVPLAALLGAGCGGWSLAFTAFLVNRGDGEGFNVLFRFIVLPLTLFSGSFFPVTTFPEFIRWVVWFSPLWHANELGRLAGGQSANGPVTVLHLVFLAALALSGLACARRLFTRRLVL